MANTTEVVSARTSPAPPASTCAPGTRMLASWDRRRDRPPGDDCLAISGRPPDGICLVVVDADTITVRPAYSGWSISQGEDHHCKVIARNHRWAALPVAPFTWSDCVSRGGVEVLGNVRLRPGDDTTESSASHQQQPCC